MMRVRINGVIMIVKLVYINELTLTNHSKMYCDSECGH